MKHYSRFKIACALYGFFILGDFLGGLFVHQDNKVALVLIAMIPTIAILAYMSLIVHSVQPAPAKKPKPIPRRSSPVARRNVKAVR